MNIEKMINDRLPLILNVTLAGGAMIGVFVLLPMMDRVKGLKDVESFMAQDSGQVSGLLRKRDKNSLNQQLLNLKDASKVVDEITAVGMVHSIVFLSMSSQEKNKSLYKKINTLPVDLETQSTYQQLALFMGALKDLSQGIIFVENFQINRDTEESGKVRSKMRLHILLKVKGNGKK
jgi:hypothetical protein